MMDSRLIGIVPRGSWDSSPAEDVYVAVLFAQWHYQYALPKRRGT